MHKNKILLSCKQAYKKHDFHKFMCHFNKKLAAAEYCQGDFVLNTEHEVSAMVQKISTKEK
jgi:hypothetical protein